MVNTNPVTVKTTLGTGAVFCQIYVYIKKERNTKAQILKK